MNKSLNLDNIDERFFIHGRMEILSQLNDLIYRQEPVTLQFESGCFVTRLLDARSENLIFEAAGNAHSNQQLLASAACVFLAYPDGIRVQFATPGAQSVSWDDSDAFSVPLPSKLARLQRQESFRIVIPADRQVQVTLFAQDGSSFGERRLHDLSSGGLGVSINAQQDLVMGNKVARVRLQLPHHGAIESAVALRHATDLTEPGLQSAYRLGLAFIDLPPQMRVAIQRYIVDSAQVWQSQGHGPETEGLE